MAVLAPMPRARVHKATRVNPGDLLNWRTAKRKSCNKVLTVPPLGLADWHHTRTFRATLLGRQNDAFSWVCAIRAVSRRSNSSGNEHGCPPAYNPTVPLWTFPFMLPMSYRSTAQLLPQPASHPPYIRETAMHPREKPLRF